MKTPRIDDFDPNAKKLKSSMEDFPAIQKPSMVIQPKAKKQEGVSEKIKSQQNDKSTNQHVDKSPISTKTAKRFTTYLSPESLKAIRRIANDEERFDYEIFQEAIDLFLERKQK